MEGGTREIRAPDGRRLTAWIEGEGENVVVIHAGTPEGGRLHDFDLEAAAKRGFTCVGYSRPGYAGSDRQPGRSIADCAGDVVAIVDALGIDSFFTIGRSGGGGHALACAALLPDRIRAAATVGASAPRQASGLDWYAGMANVNLREFGAAEAGEEALRGYLEAMEERWLAAGPDDVPALFGDLLPEDAEQEMPQADKEFSLESMRDAFAMGIWGWFDDNMAWIRDWGVDLASIGVPVSIWHATEDRFMPPAHGRWLAENIPGASWHLCPGDHMDVAKRAFGEILDRFLEDG